MTADAGASAHARRLHVDFFKEYAGELAALERMSGNAGARTDYVQGGGGNTSVKLGGMMAIKASGYRLSQVNARGGYAVLDMAALGRFFGESDPNALSDVEGEGTRAVKGAVVTIDGLEPLRPSVEAGFHSLLKKYVLHSHCVWVNIAACAEGGQEVIARALDGSGLDYCFVRYVDPGAALTFEIRAALREFEREHGRMPGLIFLQNHGLIATADSAEEATRLHERASQLLAKHFGWDMADYPACPLNELGENEFESGCAYLRERLASGRFGARELLEESLYPDQMVFFRGSVEFCAPGDKSDAACRIYPDGSVRYSCARVKAEAIEQTLTAVVLIRETQALHGLRTQPMDRAAQSFIAGWEAEAARRKLMSR